MSDYIFLFDLDATITKAEILPKIAGRINRSQEMAEITEKTMSGEIPFRQSFLSRVALLKDVPISEAKEIAAAIPLNRQVVEFIRRHKNRCYIATGNLDVWVEDLLKEIGLEKDRCFCSKAAVARDRVMKVEAVLDKAAVLRQLSKPVVAVGDGSNDAEMIKLAEIGIGFGGVRPIAPSVLENAAHAVYDEAALCLLLESLL